MHQPSRNKIRVLFVEDSLDDYELILNELKKLKFPIEQALVSEVQELHAALEKHRWDVILVDLNLPTLTAFDSLKIIREANIGDVPVIVVSGTVGEDVAVETLRAGAQDYVLKGSLTRLVPAIERELEARRLRLERMRSIQDLEDSEARFAGIVAQAMDAIISIDENQNILLFNAAAESMFGYSATDIIGKPLGTIIPPEFRAQHETHVQDFSEGSPTKRNMRKLGELRGLRSDDTEFPIEASISLQHHRGRRLMTAIVRDISQRKRLEDQLYQSQKFEVLGEIAGGVAHDFNNMLGVILGYAELTRAELSAGSKPSENINSIMVAARRSKDLVSQILTFGSGHSKFAEPLRVGDVCEEVIKLLGGTSTSGLQLILKNRDPGEDIVKVQRVHLQQLLMNLCANAIHALRNAKNPTLTVEIEHKEIREPAAIRSAIEGSVLQPGAYVKILVRDNGKGIPAHLQREIFKPFFTTKPRGVGSGLGLAVVSRIVLSYHGTICLESTPEQGTTFEILLPFCSAQPESSTENALESLRGSGRVLLVDDEEMLCSLIRQMLELLGYTVDSYFGPKKALAAFKGCPQKYDIIITDHSMPEMDGTTLIQEARKCREDLPCILSSGYGEAADMSKLASDKRPVKMIAKPFTLDELGRSVRASLQPAQ